MGCWALRRGQKSGEIDETTTCDGGLDIYTYRGMDAVEASPTASVGQLMATTAAHVWVWKPRLWRRLCDPLMVMVTLVTVSSTRRNPASRRYRRKQTPWEWQRTEKTNQDEGPHSHPQQLSKSNQFQNSTNQADNNKSRPTKRECDGWSIYLMFEWLETRGIVLLNWNYFTIGF